MFSETATLSEHQTSTFAQRLANELIAGDCILLSGVVGAGKTHFARQIIQKRLSDLNQFEDVPSPTFTLVQTYELDGVEIWHADLYRLSDSQEAFELGLEDAIETQICLIEWPDRLGAYTPDAALSIHFDIIEDTVREIHLGWKNPAWGSKISISLKDLTDV